MAAPVGAAPTSFASEAAVLETACAAADRGAILRKDTWFNNYCGLRHTCNTLQSYSATTELKAELQGATL